MATLSGVFVPFLAGAVIGIGSGWVAASEQSDSRLDRVVAISWGDGSYGPAFYGAHVYLEPRGDVYSVHAQVFIGRGNGYRHELGELGEVAHPEAAVARWGRLEWSEDGLRIGTGPDAVFFPREKLERHR